MPFVVECDIEDGNFYVPGALGFTDSVATAQEWDQIPYGGSVPLLNGAQAGVLGTPLLAKDLGGRLFIPQGVNGTLNTNVNVSSVQVLDTTPSAGAAVNSGTNGTASGNSYGHVIVRVAGLTAPSTRVLQLLGARSDLSTVVIASTTFAATVTDAVATFGTGDAAPAVPQVGSTTYVGFNFPGMIPSQFQINLTAGAAGDNPRITGWARSFV
jgi:hypothetical protein